MTLPGKDALLEREQRWGKKAGLTAFVAVALILLAITVRFTAGNPDGDFDAARLLYYHENGGVLLLADVLSSLGIALFSVPLYFLFKAAQGRTSRVRGALVVFILIGPLLLATQGVIRTVALNDVGDQFAREAPSAQDRKDAADAADAAAGDSTAKTATETTGVAAKKDATETTGAGKADKAEPTTVTETTSSDSSSGNEDADPREQEAQRLAEDSQTLRIATTLIFPGLLGFVAAMIYTPLWATRVGLMTRFWAILGMALGVALVILGPVAQLLLGVWFLHLGFLLTGWGRSRPPAWAAGAAVPWPKPGQVPPGEPPENDGTVEGSGRELDPPATGEPPEEPSDPHPGATLEGTQGERRKKRKRRG
ncbi:MAG: hypothetical protein EXQ70_06535 [Solirubrobacterales bacterium]|nr:hypothetical protein [Solirubrobacterales bacterium]